MNFKYVGCQIFHTIKYVTGYLNWFDNLYINVCLAQWRWAVEILNKSTEIWLRYYSVIYPKSLTKLHFYRVRKYLELWLAEGLNYKGFMTVVMLQSSFWHNCVCAPSDWWVTHSLQLWAIISILVWHIGFEQSNGIYAPHLQI